MLSRRRGADGGGEQSEGKERRRGTASAELGEKKRDTGSPRLAEEARRSARVRGRYVATTAWLFVSRSLVSRQRNGYAKEEKRYREKEEEEGGESSFAVALATL